MCIFYIDNQENPEEGISDEEVIRSVVTIHARPVTFQWLRIREGMDHFVYNFVWHIMNP